MNWFIKLDNQLKFPEIKANTNLDQLNGTKKVHFALTNVILESI